MRNTICILLLAALALLPGPAAAQETARPAPPPEPLKIGVGDIAPDFTLLHFDGEKVRPVTLSEFRGKKNVIVAFFVFAFTGG